MIEFEINVRLRCALMHIVALQTPENGFEEALTQIEERCRNTGDAIVLQAYDLKAVQMGMTFAPAVIEVPLGWSEIVDVDGRKLYLCGECMKRAIASGWVSGREESSKTSGDVLGETIAENDCVSEARKAR